MAPKFTMTEQGFGVIDYVIFLVLCLASCSGGLYYSATSSKREQVKDVRDYLLGGKTMSTLPVAMSLIASYVSGVTILGTPAEIYNYGSQYMLIVVGVCLSCACVATVYLPVFCTLRLSSSYEYLELRFNKNVRAVASFLFLLDEILFLPMVVYVPCLAFNQLTGAPVTLIGGIMVLICGLYTVLGGLRAVVWTDAVQTIIMFVGVITVVIAATVALGGIGNIARIASLSNRLSIDNWSFNPMQRQTGWGAVIGGFLYWTCFNSVNQTMVQRYIALPSKKKAIYALMIFCLGGIVSIACCVWCGLTAWVAWVEGGCDPGGVPLVDDRLLPAFVTYVSKRQNLPGLGGIFLAGVFGAGLSSLSCVLNACALVVIEDLLRGWLQLSLPSFQEGLLARGVTAVLAILSVVLLVVVEKLGGVLGVATALSAIAASATCGIFTLGMACWWVGPRGATVGGIAGALVAGSVSFGTQAAAAQGYRWPPMPMTEGCIANSTYVAIEKNVDASTIFPLFRISYHWIAPLGLFATLFVGATVGYFFDNAGKVPMDAELFTPCVHRWLPRSAIEHAGTTRRSRHKDDTPPSAPLILSLVEKDAATAQTSGS